MAYRKTKTAVGRARKGKSITMRRSHYSTELINMRKAMGWKQKTLAARLGCSPAQVSKWEGRRATPRASSLAMMTDLASERGYDFRIYGSKNKVRFLAAEASEDLKAETAPPKVFVDKSPGKLVRKIRETYEIKHAIVRLVENIDWSMELLPSCNESQEQEKAHLSRLLRKVRDELAKLAG